ncbi:MAG: hypothetical protein R6V03_03195 [Kiritimatiellia bacterium]
MRIRQIRSLCLFLIAALAVTACVHSGGGEKTTVAVSPGSGGVSAYPELRRVAETAVGDLVSLGAVSGRDVPLRAALGEIRNNTRRYLDDRDLISRLRSELLKSDCIRVVDPNEMESAAGGADAEKASGAEYVVRVTVSEMETAPPSAPDYGNKDTAWYSLVLELAGTGTNQAAGAVRKEFPREADFPLIGW